MLKVRLRVVSYNILASIYTPPGRYDYVAPADLAPVSRWQRIMSQLAVLRPHLLLLQEVETNTFALLQSNWARVCGLDGFHAVRPRRAEGPAIFVSRDTFAVQSAHVLTLSQEREVVAPALVLTERATNRSLVVVSVHLTGNPKCELVGARWVGGRGSAGRCFTSACV